MGFQPAPVDLEFSQQVKVIIDFNKPKPVVAPHAGFTAWPIPFQFAPKITQDGKKISWKQTAQSFYEPIVRYNGADARQIQLKWRYVVTGGRWNGMGWTPSEIHVILSNLKAYYYRTVNAFGAVNIGNSEQMPIIKIQQLYAYIPGYSGVSTWRSTSINITPSDRFVKYGDSIYPVYVDISMDLLLITQVAIGLADEEAAKGEGELGQAFGNIPAKPNKDWF